MNNCLAGIAIHFADHRECAVGIDETLGVYCDYPTPKGCTSQFAPAWIAKMVRREASRGTRQVARHLVVGRIVRAGPTHSTSSNAMRP